MWKFLKIGFFLLLLVTAVFFIQEVRKPILLPKQTPKGELFYQTNEKHPVELSISYEGIPQITQLEFTPDGRYMLVGTLPGTIFIFHKTEDGFQRQKEPFHILNTGFTGWPPQEAGLTGITLGADFEKSSDIFLEYSFRAGKKEFKNRVTRLTFTETWQKKALGKKEALIFDANTPGDRSHQIQDGIGVMVDKKPHLLFSIGEGFKAKQALNPKLEAGKLILIQRDGSTALGKRPFPDSPKVQAIGLRNPPAIAPDPQNGYIAVGDTGPNDYDRFLYGKMVDLTGNNDKKISFNWTGKDASLLLPVTDPFNNNANMNLFQWKPTETPVNVVFYENKKLPALRENQRYVLVSLFGRSGQPINKPGKRIVLGTLTHGLQNSVAFETLVERSPSGEGKLGHPLGLAVDPQSNNIYFGDILEKRIYKLKFR